MLFKNNIYRTTESVNSKQPKLRIQKKKKTYVIKSTIKEDQKTT